ncbi:hypothetical protein ACFSM5_15625 [Lacibacterium aquatile]|uniref:Lipoprotein n=1 Tax=Lacibacterium aquatile TaxID=1168082 RepID=A0ABW5DUG8_9PROT
MRANFLIIGFGFFLSSCFYSDYLFDPEGFNEMMYGPIIVKPVAREDIDVAVLHKLFGPMCAPIFQSPDKAELPLGAWSRDRQMSIKLGPFRADSKFENNYLRLAKKTEPGWGCALEKCVTNTSIEYIERGEYPYGLLYKLMTRPDEVRQTQIDGLESNVTLNIVPDFIKC